MVLNHSKILLNLPNVKSYIIKITPTKNRFIKNILYFILNADKKGPRLKLQYYNLMINRTSWHDSCIARTRIKSQTLVSHP